MADWDILNISRKILDVAGFFPWKIMKQTKKGRKKGNVSHITLKT